MRRIKVAIGLFAILGITLLAWLSPAPPPVLAQQPTGSIATVTGTEIGYDPRIRKVDRRTAQSMPFVVEILRLPTVTHAAFA